MKKDVSGTQGLPPGSSRSHITGLTSSRVPTSRQENRGKFCELMMASFADRLAFVTSDTDFLGRLGGWRLLDELGNATPKVINISYSFEKNGDECVWLEIVAENQRGHMSVIASDRFYL